MDIWYSISAIVIAILAISASAHAVLVKREPRAAALWVVILWLVPLLGAVLYLLFGMNRIERRASELHKPPLERRSGAVAAPREAVALALGADRAHLNVIRNIMDRVCQQPLLDGNAIQVLVNGEQAFPAMMQAIESAQKSISLATYIFGNDRIGRRFARALRDAVRRGVEVRVLIDDAGERYSWPSMVGVLERAGVPVARFFPDFRSRVTAVNLRNHRKILVVDGHIGFTGGMNLRIHHLQNQRRLATRDLHFRVEGPIVGQFQEVFAQDWKFSTRESLRGERWFPRLSAVGSVLARAVPDGPDDDFDKLHWVLHAALHAARHRVRVMTPYFLPDRTLVNALNLAALRGVEVEILLPARNNLPFVHWAMVAQLWQVLDQGCRVWFTAPPFDHSKVMVVDDAWSLIGSANWDPRSLRLNFELDVECYDMDLSAQLNQRMDAALDGATPVTMSTLNARSLPIRLRDGIARLFMPFL